MFFPAPGRVNPPGRSRPGRALSLSLVWALLSGLVMDCAARRPAPVLPVPELTAEQVVDYLQRRGQTLHALEAKLEVESFGRSESLTAKLFGGLRILRQGEELQIEAQAYLPLGAPAFHLLAQGSRYQLFLPLEKRYYTNSPELCFGRVPAEVGAQDRVAGWPAELFYEQIGLLFGRIPLAGAEYLLLQTPEHLLLEESQAGVVRRRIFLDPVTLEFQSLEVGAGRVEFFPNSRRRSEEFGWIPRGITLLEQGQGFQLTLSRLQVNLPGQPAVEFREPGSFPVYLIEPNAEAVLP